MTYEDMVVSGSETLLIPPQIAAVYSIIVESHLSEHFGNRPHLAKRKKIHVIILSFKWTDLARLDRPESGTIW